MDPTIERFEDDSFHLDGVHLFGGMADGRGTGNHETEQDKSHCGQPSSVPEFRTNPWPSHHPP